MCGRFAQESLIEEIQQIFEIDHITCELTPQKEIYPTEKVPAIIMHKSKTRLGQLCWGLVPRWSKEKPKRPLINARIETLSQKPSFRDSFRFRRCLIIADGYYEWKKKVETDSKKTKYLFQLSEKRPFAIAGLWDTWRQTHHSCTIITKDAVDAIKDIHHRMPVILDASSHREWLDPTNNDTAHLYHLLADHAVGELVFHEIPEP